MSEDLLFFCVIGICTFFCSAYLIHKTSLPRPVIVGISLVFVPIMLAFVGTHITSFSGVDLMFKMVFFLAFLPFLSVPFFEASSSSDSQSPGKVRHRLSPWYLIYVLVVAFCFLAFLIVAKAQGGEFGGLGLLFAGIVLLIYGTSSIVLSSLLAYGWTSYLRRRVGTGKDTPNS